MDDNPPDSPNPYDPHRDQDRDQAALTTAEGKVKAHHDVKVKLDKRRMKKTDRKVSGKITFFLELLEI